jgi:restriction system protein
VWTGEGKLIEAVTIPWFEIVALLKENPNVAFQISPEKWEEIVAGAYNRAGFDKVTLTPRSGDRGRDVIAVKKGIGSVRIIDQVKAFHPSHLVTADDVRAHGCSSPQWRVERVHHNNLRFRPKDRDGPPNRSLCAL